MRRILTILSVSILVIGSFTAEASGRTLVVKKVHSGDIIEFEGGWTTRLSGVDAPDPDEPLGQEVLQFTRQELEGKRVACATYTLDNTAAGILYDHEGYPHYFTVRVKDNKVLRQRAPWRPRWSPSYGDDGRDMTEWAAITDSLRLLELLEDR